MPDEKPTPEKEGPPAPVPPEKAARPSKKKDEEKEEPKAPRAPKKLEGVKEDFRYIVRMANTDLDGTRSVGYALTAIPGVGSACPRPSRTWPACRARNASGICRRSRRTRSRRR